MEISSVEGAMWVVNKYILPEFQVFDNEVVIYQQGSGFTHLISLFGAEILTLLLIKSRSIEELTEILIESSEGVKKQELSEHVQQYLNHCLLLNIVNYHPNES